jgi:hypothetical protein
MHVSTKEYARKWHTLSDLAPMNPISQQPEPEQGEKRSMSDQNDKWSFIFLTKNFSFSHLKEY